MKYALTFLSGAILAGVIVWGLCSDIASRNERENLATIGYLREEIAGLGTIAGDLKRVNRELEERVKSSSGRVVKSIVYVDRIRDLNIEAGRTIEEGLGDVEYIRETIQSLPVLGGR